jgi:hypothetical protein
VFAVLKPVSAKAKLIITKSTEATVPKLLLDVVLQDTVLQMSRAQFSSMVALQEAFQRIDKNRQDFFSVAMAHTNEIILCSQGVQGTPPRGESAQKRQSVVEVRVKRRPGAASTTLHVEQYQEAQV